MNAQPHAQAPRPYTFAVDSLGSGVPFRILPKGRDHGQEPLALIESGQGSRSPGGFPLRFVDPRSHAPMCLVQQDGSGSYGVYAADGSPLARISRRQGRFLPWPRRTRWALELGQGAGKATGKQGTWYAWTLFTLLSPFWVLFFVAYLVYNFVVGDGLDDDPKVPARTRLRVHGSGTALDYRGVSEVYHFNPRRLDVRVAYAVATLHRVALQSQAG